MSQKVLTLFEETQILPGISQEQAIQYLKKYCIIDVLGDTIYPKKPGTNQTTYAITFEPDKMVLLKKINDSAGNKADEILFDRAYDENSDFKDDDTYG